MQLGLGPVLTYSEDRGTWSSTSGIDVEQVRRLTLESDYLWVYPVLGESRVIVVSVDVRNAVSQLLLKRSVYVEKSMVAVVREALKREGKGNQA